MVDIASISAALGGLKAASDIASGMMELKAGVDVQTKVIELQREILSAQQSAMAAQADQSALAQRIDDLEAEIAQLKNWDAEKQKYELQWYWPDTYAYVLKSEAKGNGSAHKLCTNCFDQANKSLLQATAITMRRYRIYDCPRCKTNFSFGGLRTEGGDQPA